MRSERLSNSAGPGPSLRMTRASPARYARRRTAFHRPRAARDDVRPVHAAEHDLRDLDDRPDLADRHHVGLVAFHRDGVSGSGHDRAVGRHEMPRIEPSLAGDGREQLVALRALDPHRAEVASPPDEPVEKVASL